MYLFVIIKNYIFIIIWIFATCRLDALQGSLISNVFCYKLDLDKFADRFIMTY